MDWRKYTRNPPFLMMLGHSDRLLWFQPAPQDVIEIQFLPPLLETLRLSRLNLLTVPDAVKCCTNLKVLDLSHNDLVLRRTWSAQLVAAGGANDFFARDFSAAIWLGEMPSLVELNLVDAVTVLGIDPAAAGALTPQQVAAAQAFYQARDQLNHQFQQAHQALRQVQCKNGFDEPLFDVVLRCFELPMHS